MKKKKEDALFFIQNWGTFFGNTLVACRIKDYAELHKFLQDRGYEEWARAIKNKPDEHTTPHFSKWISQRVNKDGSTEKEITYSLLWLPTWKPDLVHYKVLAHELVHAVSFLMPDFLDPMKENEAFAYQHSYLFEEIARRLTEKPVDKPKTKRKR